MVLNEKDRERLATVITGIQSSHFERKELKRLLEDKQKEVIDLAKRLQSPEYGKDMLLSGDQVDYITKKHPEVAFMTPTPDNTAILIEVRGMSMHIEFQSSQAIKLMPWLDGRAPVMYITKPVYDFNVTVKRKCPVIFKNLQSNLGRTTANEKFKPINGTHPHAVSANGNPFSNICKGGNPFTQMVLQNKINNIPKFTMFLDLMLRWLSSDNKNDSHKNPIVKGIPIDLIKYPQVNDRLIKGMIIRLANFIKGKRCKNSFRIKGVTIPSEPMFLNLYRIILIRLCEQRACSILNSDFKNYVMVDIVMSTLVEKDALTGRPKVCLNPL